MKTWEVFKALEENPKRKFKQDRFTLSVNDRGYFYLNHDKWDHNTSAGGFNGNISKYVDWEEIKQPVSWQEAIAAWANGKTIRCEYHDETRTYSKDISEDQNGQMMNRLEIKNGTWHIED